MKYKWKVESRRAGQLVTEGRIQDAIIIYREISQANPRYPEIHNNLGVALRAAGLPADSLRSYRKALQLAPKYKVARANLARVLAELGRHEEALQNYVVLLQSSSNDSGIISGVIQTLTEMKIERPSAVVRKILLVLFKRKDIDHQALAAPTIVFLLAHKRFSELVEVADKVYPMGDPKQPLITRELADPLLIMLLKKTIVPLPKVEAWITLVRRQLLAWALEGKKITANPSLLWGLVAQCQNTELAQIIDPVEQSNAKYLLKSVASVDSYYFAISAMFIPFPELAKLDIPFKASAAEVPSENKNVFEHWKNEKQRERRIEITLPTLTTIKDKTSVAVQEQYESNPYPKWLYVDRDNDPTTLQDRMFRLFPTIQTQYLDLISPEILVAGCGTGRHAISTASRYKGCNVLAIDLSRQSLAYGAQRANFLGVDNISFAQGDILELERLDKRFDLIESSGVLHHLGDPGVGWQILRKLLKPGGLMRVGLYSALARNQWHKLRQTIPENSNSHKINDFIRSYRANLLTNPPTGPEAIVLRFADFYSISGCRDLLFHTKESQLTLPKIADYLQKLDLKFMGFANLSSSTMNSFENLFPESYANLDLLNWDIFEQKNPHTFIAMYQFWCQAID